MRLRHVSDAETFCQHMQNYVKTIQLRTKGTTDREKREREREEDGARIA